MQINVHNNELLCGVGCSQRSATLISILPMPQEELSRLFERRSAQCVSLCTSACMCVCPSVLMSVCVSIFVSVCLSIYLSVRMSNCLCMFLLHADTVALIQKMKNMTIFANVAVR